MKRAAIYGILLSLIFCLPQPVLAGSEPNPQTSFIKEEFLADYDFLWQELSASYLYLPVLSDQGVNLETLREGNRQSIEARTEDLHSFVWVLRDTFRVMGNLAHLSLVDASSYDSYIGQANQVDILPAPWDQLLTSQQTRATYALLGAGQASADYEPPGIAFRYLPEVNAAYFRFSTFSAESDRDRDVIANCLEGLGEVDHIIIDVTGNPGGMLDYWEENIVYPFGGEYAFDRTVYYKNSPTSTAFFTDDQRAAARPLADFPEVERLPAFTQTLGLTHYIPQHVEYTSDAYTGKTIESQAQRWVLIDGMSFSAADTFAAFCKDTGWATLVGQPTMGDGGAASIVSITMTRLPNTGLLVRFSAVTTANRDGTPNGVVGTAPDILSKPKETPLDACLRVILAK